LHVGTGARLLAHGVHGGGGWTDEGDARRFTGPDERGVLAEEAVSRVDGVRARFLRRVEDALEGQVRLARGRRSDPERLVRHPQVEGSAVRVRVDGNRGNAELPA